MPVPIVKIVPVRRKKITSYQLDYTLHGKRFRYIVAHNKKNAELIKAKVQQDLTLGIHGIQPAQSRIISLKDLMNQYLSSKSGVVREVTHARYKNYFDGFEKFMYKYFAASCDNIRLITHKYLQECFNRLRKEPVNKTKPWHPTTINILRDLLIEMFNSAIEEKYIEKNPASLTNQLDAPQKDTLRFYTKEQLDEIWKNLEPNWVPLFKFYAFTGLRKNELLSLTWVNVSLDDKNPYIRIITTTDFRPKGRRSNTIRITKQALDILKSQHGKNAIYVFPSKRGKKIRQAQPNEELNKALSKIGITGTVHMFRHTFASHFLMDGVGNLNDLQNYLSQADSETTKIYAHLSNEYQAEIVKKLEKTQKKMNKN